ncbi:MAG: hypothetical protein ACK4NF_06970 [Planctomycetota bacterium]
MSKNSRFAELVKLLKDPMKVFVKDNYLIFLSKLYILIFDKNEIRENEFNEFVPFNEKVIIPSKKKVVVNTDSFTNLQHITLDMGLNLVPNALPLIGRDILAIIASKGGYISNQVLHDILSDTAGSFYFHLLELSRGIQICAKFNFFTILFIVNKVEGVSISNAQEPYYTCIGQYDVLNNKQDNNDTQEKDNTSSEDNDIQDNDDNILENNDDGYIHMQVDNVNVY